MPKINETERQTQDRILHLFCSAEYLDYEYAGNLQHTINTNIREKDLLAWLTDSHGGGYSITLAEKAIDTLVKAANNLEHGLYHANQTVYTLLKYGIPVTETAGKTPTTVYLIDWVHPLQNRFFIAEEVTIRSESERRPDLVVFVNGIALAVLELKRATVSVAAGIRQLLSNQEPYFNKPFFSTIQFCIAGNYTEGL